MVTPYLLTKYYKDSMTLKNLALETITTLIISYLFSTLLALLQRFANNDTVKEFY